MEIFLIVDTKINEYSPHKEYSQLNRMQLMYINEGHEIPEDNDMVC